MLDRVEPTVAPSGMEDFVQADLDDAVALGAACADVDLVIHLGGLSTERSWEDIVAVNVTGSRTVLEAAHLAGVRRVLLASSIHAVGMATAGDTRNTPVVPARPDTFYGVGKVAMEALGSVYADRHGMSVVSARIANFADRPDGHRGLAFWFSAADMVRLIDACADLDSPGHRIVWGVSANTRGWVDVDAGREIGFEPLDDAESFADEILGAAGDLPLTGESLLAGGFLAPGRELGVPWK